MKIFSGLSRFWLFIIVSCITSGSVAPAPGSEPEMPDELAEIALFKEDFIKANTEWQEIQSAFTALDEKENALIPVIQQINDANKAFIPKWNLRSASISVKEEALNKLETLVAELETKNPIEKFQKIIAECTLLIKKIEKMPSIGDMVKKFSLKPTGLQRDTRTFLGDKRNEDTSNQKVMLENIEEYIRRAGGNQDILKRLIKDSKEGLEARSKEFRLQLNAFKEQVKVAKEEGAEIDEDTSLEDYEKVRKARGQELEGDQKKLLRGWIVKLGMRMAGANAYLPPNESPNESKYKSIYSFVYGSKDEAGLVEELRLAYNFRDGKTEKPKEEKEGRPATATKKVETVGSIYPNRGELEDLVTWFDKFSNNDKRKFFNLKFFELEKSQVPEGEDSYSEALAFIRNYIEEEALKGDVDPFEHVVPSEKDSELTPGQKSLPKYLQTFFTEERKERLPEKTTFPTLLAKYLEDRGLDVISTVRKEFTSEELALRKELTAVFHFLWCSSTNQDDIANITFHFSLKKLEEKKAALEKILADLAQKEAASELSDAMKAVAPHTKYQSQFARIKQIYSPKERSKVPGETPKQAKEREAEFAAHRSERDELALKVFGALQRARAKAKLPELPDDSGNMGSALADRLKGLRDQAMPSGVLPSYAGSRLDFGNEGALSVDDAKKIKERTDKTFEQELDEERNFAGNESGRKARGQRTLINNLYEQFAGARVEELLDGLERSRTALDGRLEDGLNSEVRKEVCNSACALIRGFDVLREEIKGMAEELKQLFDEKHAEEFKQKMNRLMKAKFDKSVSSVEQTFTRCSGQVIAKLPRLTNGKRNGGKLLEAELVWLGSMLDYVASKFTEPKDKAKFEALNKRIEAKIGHIKPGQRGQLLDETKFLVEYSISELGLHDSFKGIKSIEGARVKTSVAPAGHEQKMRLVCDCCPKEVKLSDEKNDDGSFKYCHIPFERQGLRRTKKVMVQIQQADGSLLKFTQGAKQVNAVLNRYPDVERYFNPKDFERFDNHGTVQWNTKIDPTTGKEVRATVSKKRKDPYTNLLSCVVLELPDRENPGQRIEVYSPYPELLEDGQKFVYVSVADESKRVDFIDFHGILHSNGKKEITFEQAKFLAEVEAVCPEIKRNGTWEKVKASELTAEQKEEFDEALRNIGGSTRARTTLERLQQLDVLKMADGTQDFGLMTVGELEKLCAPQGGATLANFTDLPNIKDSPLDFSDIYKHFKETSSKHWDKVVAEAHPLSVDEFKVVVDYFAELRNKHVSHLGKPTAREKRSWNSDVRKTLAGIKRLCFDVDADKNPHLENYTLADRGLQSLFNTYFLFKHDENFPEAINMRDRYCFQRTDESPEAGVSAYNSRREAYGAIAKAVFNDAGDRTSQWWAAAGRDLDEDSRAVYNSVFYYISKDGTTVYKKDGKDLSKGSTSKPDVSKPFNLEDESVELATQDGGSLPLREVIAAIAATKDESVVTGETFNFADNVHFYAPNEGNDYYRIVIAQSAAEKRQLQKASETDDEDLERVGRGRALTHKDNVILKLPAKDDPLKMIHYRQASFDIPADLPTKKQNKREEFFKKLLGEEKEAEKDVIKKSRESALEYNTRLFVENLYPETDGMSAQGKREREIENRKRIASLLNRERLSEPMLELYTKAVAAEKDRLGTQLRKAKQERDEHKGDEAQRTKINDKINELGLKQKNLTKREAIANGLMINAVTAKGELDAIVEAEESGADADKEPEADGLEAFNTCKKDILERYPVDKDLLEAVLARLKLGRSDKIDYKADTAWMGNSANFNKRGFDILQKKAWSEVEPTEAGFKRIVIQKTISGNKTPEFFCRITFASPGNIQTVEKSDYSWPTDFESIISEFKLLKATGLSAEGRNDIEDAVVDALAGSDIILNKHSFDLWKPEVVAQEAADAKRRKDDADAAEAREKESEKTGFESAFNLQKNLLLTTYPVTARSLKNVMEEQKDREGKGRTGDTEFDVAWITKLNTTGKVGALVPAHIEVNARVVDVRMKISDTEGDDIYRITLNDDNTIASVAKSTLTGDVWSALAKVDRVECKYINGDEEEVRSNAWGVVLSFDKQTKWADGSINEGGFADEYGERQKLVSGAPEIKWD